MSRIVIVGGHGQIARLLLARLVDANHEVVSLVRNREHIADLQPVGAIVELLDIERDDAEDFAERFTNADAVIFAAGGGPDGNIGRKKTVDLGGSLKSIEGAQRAGVTRFIQISAINVDDPVAADADPVWHAYVEAKRDADLALRSSDLDWTIIRPGRLTDEPGIGLVELGNNVSRADVTRDDVAAVIAAVVDDPRTIAKQWNLVNGSQPIAAAIDTAVSS